MGYRETEGRMRADMCEPLSARLLLKSSGNPVSDDDGVTAALCQSTVESQWEIGGPDDASDPEVTMITCNKSGGVSEDGGCPVGVVDTLRDSFRMKGRREGVTNKDYRVLRDNEQSDESWMSEVMKEKGEGGYVCSPHGKAQGSDCTERLGVNVATDQEVVAARGNYDDDANDRAKLISNVDNIAIHLASTVENRHDSSQKVALNELSDVTRDVAQHIGRVDNLNENLKDVNLCDVRNALRNKPGNDVLSLTLTQDFSISVSGDNSKMCDVLQTVPLVYIPATRQLGLVDSETSVTKQSSLSECGQCECGVTPAQCSRSCHCCVNSLNLDVDVTRSDTTRSDTTRSDTTRSDTTRSDTTRSDTTRSDTTCEQPYDVADTTSVSSLSNYSNITDLSLGAASYQDGGDDTVVRCPADFVDISLQSRNSYEPCRQTDTEQFGGAKPKKKGFGTLFTKHIFSKKTKECSKTETESVPGWRLFGRVPPIYTAHKDTDSLSSDGGAEIQPIKSNHIGGPVLSNNLKVQPTRKTTIEVSSTTALILENRPGNLPSKTPEEALRHKQQYEAMVAAARKKEQRDQKQKKKLRIEQLKQEEKLVSLSKFWVNDVLPNWEVMCSCKRTLDLWWYGLPPNVRGKVWQLAIGNDLNLTHELYEICGSRAIDRIKNMSENSEPWGNSETSSEPPSSKESSVELIKLDVSRTFPQLCIFQKGGPYHDLLHSLLGAYACYRPDVGYVQGMSFIAAVLLLNMDVASAFVCFSNILNQPCQVAFFRIDEEIMKSYFATFKEFFRENLPQLYAYFTRLHLEPEVYLFDWLFTLYSKSLPLDIACRVWDIFCRDGEEFLFRTALGIIHLYQDVLLDHDFIHLAQFLTKLPENMSGEALFHSIDVIHMSIDKKRFVQVLATHRDANKDAT